MGQLKRLSLSRVTYLKTINSNSMVGFEWVRDDALYLYVVIDGQRAIRFTADFPSQLSLSRISISGGVSLAAGVDSIGAYLIIYSGDGDEHWTFRPMTSETMKPRVIYFSPDGAQEGSWDG